MPRKRSLVGVLLLAASLTLGLAGSAAATAPLMITDEFEMVVEDLEGEQCGFPIRWEIRGVAELKFFSDSDGQLVRAQAHVQEDNLLTNLDTGETLRDRPVFNQMVEINEDGTFANITTTGLFVNVRGEAGASVMDVGRVVINVLGPTERELAFEAGQHPFRAETIFGLEDGLSAFCELLG